MGAKKRRLTPPLSVFVSLVDSNVFREFVLSFRSRVRVPVKKKKHHTWRMPSSQSRVTRSLPTPWPRVTMDSIFRQALLFSALFLAFGGDKVLAQTTNVTCLPSFDWALNSAKENPCKVASELQAVCGGGKDWIWSSLLFAFFLHLLTSPQLGWTVTSLPPNYHYIGESVTPIHPNFYVLSRQTKGPVKGSDTNGPNYCTCTSIVYELMSACGACQNRTFISYPAWTVDCGNISTVEGVYTPSLIPSGALVPRWAYLKPSSYGGLFNIEVAKQIGVILIEHDIIRRFHDSLYPFNLHKFHHHLIYHKQQSNDDDDDNDDNDNDSIWGKFEHRPNCWGAVGGVVGLGLVAVLAVWVLKRRSGKPPSQNLAVSGPSLNDGSTRPLSMATAPQPAFQEPYFVTPTNHHPPYNIQNPGYSGAPEP
ncbi:uncharacterized protein EI90DRAFT_3286048 [Cantharellus anzutake]|uniref:uncharacterized protein n=1 Tax=Cantharellus anzutake TaxID=1750568 RepID=UPI001907200C|nr:uncharacterized protein EI90DRAFT_3286048 [Cantharellus anzutake]KAF8339531.1 hypothetical protein EI90DRAFT_3286048 [Cantharellus anzutake]